MRLSVSFKAFAVFSCLAATTGALGAAAYWGLSDLRRAAARIEKVKDFQIQLGRIELFNRTRKLRLPATEGLSFDEEFRRAEALANAVTALGPELPAQLQARVGSLAEHLGYVRSAFQDLFAMYARERALVREEADLHEQIYRALLESPPGPRLSLFPTEHTLAELAERVVREFDSADLVELKRLAGAARRQAGTAEFAAIADRLVISAERAYLNHLGVKDREKFLSDAQKRFSDIAGETVTAIGAAARARQDQITRVLVATVLFSALLMLLLWRASMRYILAFLRHIREALGSIRAGHYDYPVPPLPEDELGEVVVFLKDMAGSLRESVRKTTESEQKFRSLVEGISDWVWEVDPKGCFTYSSPVVSRMLGYAPDELLGRRPEELMDAVDATRFGQALREVAERREQGAFEVEVVRKDGAPIVLELSWQPIDGSTGEPGGLRGIGRDVTERKKAEVDQARLRAQLLQAQKMEAIGTLTGGIAHDFNNLLQSVSVCTELLLRGRAEQDRDYSKLRTIEQAVRRAAELTRNLLVFGRKVESRFEALDVNEVVGRARELVERIIPKMVGIQEDLAEDLPEIRGDPTQLELVLLNLALNAKDAMPTGGRLLFETSQVWVGPNQEGTPKDLTPGRYVRLRVSDTGTGMEAATVERVFEPFFTTKEVGKGTGLGLAMVYGIVQSHDGHVSCRSQPGEGTIFDIYLPEALGASAGDSPPERRDPEAATGTETVLLVDDEESILSLGAEILEERGYKVLMAKTGEEAMAVLEAHRSVDLVVLDVNMPGMGGLECLRSIRRRDPDAKVVLASGYPPGELRPQLLEAGASCFVQKPYRIAQFLKEVRTTLDGVAPIASP